MNDVTHALLKAFPNDIDTIRVDKSELHGEKAVEVVVNLFNGKQVTGTFTRITKNVSGSTESVDHKDVAGLMVAKVKSVLNGTYEKSET